MAKDEDKNEITFEKLNSGEKEGFVCDRRRLIQVQDSWKTKTAKEKFTEQVEENLSDLGGRSRRIVQFYIGKAYVNKKNKDEPLNPTRPETWDKGGINSRWDDHKENYNGLIVLTVVSRDVVKDENITIDKQDYALMLEQLLLYHYKVDKKDVKLQNENFAQGSRGENNDGYAVYMAVKLRR